jgi:thymidylate synthase
MIPIKADCLGRAHMLVVQRILEHGEIVVTQDGELTLELRDAVIEVQTPWTPPMVHPGSNFQDKKLVEYVDGLLFGKKGEFTYTYHERLFNWKLWQEGCTPVHQIDEIIKYLGDAKNRDSRRAVAITWYPGMDLDYSGPCLQFVQFLIRDGKLHMTVLFRSNDMLSALGANMYALVSLQQYVAAKLGIPTGEYCHHSVSAHMYVIRDQHELESMFMKEHDISRNSARQGLIKIRPDIPWKV